jgi:lipoic acid synthetase
MAIFKELTVLTPYDIAPDEEARPINPARAREILNARKPDWLRIRPPGGENYTKIKSMLRERKLHTVCEEAHCPNVAECWAGGTATFMIGGDTCTRACRFCAIKTARRPPPLDPSEPKHVAESVATLGLKYVVLTSVDRDDMKDGGAAHFAETIRGIKKLNPAIIVEALVPDFQGDVDAIRTIVESGLDVYAHNVETTKRLQYRVRDPRAGYLQSLSTLRAAKNIAAEIGHPLFTKTSIMLGLGETKEELREAFADLREFDVDVLTLGQYLRPSMNHLPVDSFYTPEEYTELGREAETHGFLYVASGPMVRSSYKAGEFFIQGVIEKRRMAAAMTSIANEVKPTVYPPEVKL